MKKPLLILLFTALVMTACSIYIGMQQEYLNPCNPDHSEINEQEIMIEQFQERYMEHVIKQQDQSI